MSQQPYQQPYPQQQPGYQPRPPQGLQSNFLTVTTNDIPGYRIDAVTARSSA